MILTRYLESIQYAREYNDNFQNYLKVIMTILVQHNINQNYSNSLITDTFSERKCVITLPHDIILNILEYLYYPTLTNFSMTSQEFYNAINFNDSYWSKLLFSCYSIKDECVQFESIPMNGDNDSYNHHNKNLGYKSCASKELFILFHEKMKSIIQTAKTNHLAGYIKSPPFIPLYMINNWNSHNVNVNIGFM